VGVRPKLRCAGGERERERERGRIICEKKKQKKKWEKRWFCAQSTIVERVGGIITL